MSDDGVYDDDHPSIQLASCFTDHISGIQATNQCYGSRMHKGQVLLQRSLTQLPVHAMPPPHANTEHFLKAFVNCVFYK